MLLAMSETLSNDVSTESLCTVIENSIDNRSHQNAKLNHQNINNNNNNINSNNNNNKYHKNDDLLNSAFEESELNLKNYQELDVYDLNDLSDIDNDDNRSGNWATTTTATTTEDEQTTTEVDSNRETTPEKTTSPPPIRGLSESGHGGGKIPISTKATKLKKTVSFDPNDEKVRKFISGDPIVDQQNPFKALHATSNGSSLVNCEKKKKKIPPPVPTKRSTLSIKKTVTQQLREREREKEKERERLKNEANKCKSNGTSNGPTPLVSPGDEFVTTEEVLKQSKYVKTYIKNPDPVFVYDPTILARIKFEELRELSDRKPPKKVKLTSQTKDRLRDVHGRNRSENSKPKIPTFKKCSKPNYPDLSDIKIKVGTEPDGNFFNPAEVTKNAKKFDERVKKLHISCEDDLDEIEEPLTKSESSDEITANVIDQSKLHQQQTNEDLSEIGCDEVDFLTDCESVMPNGYRSDSKAVVKDCNGGPGTFTNTINSKEFQEYLDKKGLTLIPKKIPSGAKAMYSNGMPRNHSNSTHISFKTPESVQISIDRRYNNSMDGGSKGSGAGDNGINKKPSVFQRLLANSIFATRRKTMPKESVPTPKTLHYAYSKEAKDFKDHRRDPVHGDNNATLKRVVLERQSFHGRPRVGALLSDAEAHELRAQAAQTRKSFASGDDLSISISSALTNAEYALGTIVESKQQAQQQPQMARPLTKPPRRTLSRDRLREQLPPPLPPSTTAPATLGGDDSASATTPRPKVRTLQQQSAIYTLPRQQHQQPQQHNSCAGSESLPADTNGAQLQRATIERQSLIPKRSATLTDRRQVFGRSASMDRNEILKRNAAARSINNAATTGKSKSANSTLRTTNATATATSPLTETTNLLSMKPALTSATPAGGATAAATPTSTIPKRTAFVPITTSSPLKAQAGVAVASYADQEEWERLRVTKERTDRELYHKMLQQQQQQQFRLLQQQLNQELKQQLQQQQQHSVGENIYELLPNQSGSGGGANSGATVNFVRGSPQRNTFSGVIRNNRQVKIIDGRPVMMANAIEVEQQPQQQQHVVAPRSQSVLDGMTLPSHMRSLRRGYESDNETPVVYRRKTQATPAAGDAVLPPRRIGGLLTRDEILQKVKEFCRKSLNKTPTNQPQQVQLIYAKQPPLDVSPVSYASVETQQRSGSRLAAYAAAPQVPQRVQSLSQATPQQAQYVLQPTQELIVADAAAPGNPSPIYAHVIKRSSLQSQQSELYEAPAHTLAAPASRPILLRRESDAAPTVAATQTVYIRRGGVLQPAELIIPQPTPPPLAPTAAAVPAPQYILVDGDKLAQSAQLVDLYAPQPQYVRPHQLPAVLIPGGAATYGYSTIIPQQQQQPHSLQPQPLQFRTAVRLHDGGRSTPLILDRSSQQASQIYWTPQHQRLQQQQQHYQPQTHTGLIPLEISPRYALSNKQQTNGVVYPVPAPRSNVQQLSVARAIAHQQQQHNIPNQLQQQHSPMVRVHTPPTKLQQQQAQQQQTVRRASLTEWASDSEAGGEVQRIMEQRRDSGEFKVTHALRNLRNKLAKLLNGSSSTSGSGNGNSSGKRR